MYKVKGSDGGVYGPVLAVVIQQWIAERRLNGDSLVSPDGAEEWRALRDYPEFAAALVSAALPSQPGAMLDGGRAAALAGAKTPGLLLVLFGSLMGLITVAGLASTLMQGQAATPTLPDGTPELIRNLVQMQANMPKWATYLQFVVGALVDVVVILGGIHLMRLRSRGWVVAGAILASLPCFTSCCCVLGLPLAIWVVTYSNRSDVRPYFEA